MRRVFFFGAVLVAACGVGALLCPACRSSSSDKDCGVLTASCIAGTMAQCDHATGQWQCVTTDGAASDASTPADAGGLPGDDGGAEGGIGGAAAGSVCTRSAECASGCCCNRTLDAMHCDIECGVKIGPMPPGSCVP